jgi:diaminobutyrate-2-oxoglutarate transaminase
VSATQPDVSIFESVESEVRNYCRTWPTVFARAQGSRLYAEDGREYLDFFAGAGTLNYGHNNPVCKRALVGYIEADGVIHGLDMYTTAKRDFLRAFQDLVLRPRDLPYKVMFPGPAGTNAVEAALRLARKVTGRTTVVSFTNAFHGMTLGSLSLSGMSGRADTGIPAGNNVPMPFDRYLDDADPDFRYLRALLEDRGSGFPLPAAVVVETVQGEGGVNVAGVEWLRELSELCRRYDMLLIVDDVQMGCGRTGGFFSFELAGIQPDIVTISKSISGYGLPLALTLFRPELDVWEPGEHSGTFRGNNAAFVTGTATLNTYWMDDQLTKQTLELGAQVEQALNTIVADRVGSFAERRGRGLVWGLEFAERQRARRVADRAFELGLLVETAGPEGAVVKLLPPLTSTPDELDEGLAILDRAVRESAR